MDAIPISHTFHLINGAKEMSAWETAIQQLMADEAKNPANAAIDNKEISYYKQLEANLQQMETVAAAYRQSDNDPNLAKQLNILSGKQEILTQLIELEKYIEKLKEKISKDSTENAQKIANAEAQEQCLQQFMTTWEAYQKTGDAADGEKVNFLIAELQQLRSENPTGPNSTGLSWEYFQAVVTHYTVFEFNGQKYAVSPN